ncbi:MAG: hypothetical protein GF381_02795 [Candidatus Pacebacteria bacterium]|nr:hypothetical protein [Candidatus Paceibacterota bacterium]
MNLTNQQLKKVKVVLFLLALVFSTIGFTLWFMWEIPLLSPLSSLTRFEFGQAEPTPAADHNKIVYGFLPYWNLDRVEIQPELTHLAYFGLTIGADGTIVTQADGGTEPGYRDLNSDELLTLANQVDQNQGQIELVLIQFNNDSIESLVNNPKAHQNLISSLDSILLAYPISGINLDIEYLGQADPTLRKNFVQLVKTISQHLNTKYQGVSLSIDMYASAASKEMIWDVGQIAPHVDWIVVMAYDFHRRSSPQAGPVAPLFGGKEFWEHDINYYLSQYLRIVPKHKILLGIPFYGYQWQTDSPSAQANTYPDTGSTVSMIDVEELLSRKNELQVQVHWHNKALTPYLTYIKDGQHYVAYFENARSISYKLEYVQTLDLAGIAIWALGYEGNSRALWQEIEARL